MSIKYTSFAQRFWSKVNVGEMSDCWNWIGHTVNGYGQLNRTSKNDPFRGVAHRIGWQLCFGALTESFEVGHKCANRLCVNPKHLYLTSHTENMREAVSRKNGKAYALPVSVSNVEMRAIRTMALSEQSGLSYPLVDMPKFMVCGHRVEYIISGDEGTSFCLFCEYQEEHRQLMKIKETLRED